PGALPGLGAGQFRNLSTQPTVRGNTRYTRERYMIGILTLAYGAVSYGIFFLTFLYAIGFLGNVIVPKSLDSGPTDSWPIALAIDLALLLVFALQHSVMARPGFKRLFTKI